VTSLNNPTPKTRVDRKGLRDVSYSSRVVDDFVSNFVAITTGVCRSRICLASFNSATPKTPVIHKNLADISYISHVIADFVPNFVAMATGAETRRMTY